MTPSTHLPGSHSTAATKKTCSTLPSVLSCTVTTGLCPTYPLGKFLPCPCLVYVECYRGRAGGLEAEEARTRDIRSMNLGFSRKASISSILSRSHVTVVYYALNLVWQTWSPSVWQSRQSLDQSNISIFPLWNKNYEIQIQLVILSNYRNSWDSFAYWQISPHIKGESMGQRRPGLGLNSKTSPLFCDLELIP